MELTAALIEARMPTRLLADRLAPAVPDDVLRSGAGVASGERRSRSLRIFAHGTQIWDECCDSTEPQLGTLHGMA